MAPLCALSFAGGSGSASAKSAAPPDAASALSLIAVRGAGRDVVLQFLVSSF